MRLNTFVLAMVAIVATSNVVKADGVNLLNNKVLDPLDILVDNPVTQSVQSVLGMEKRRVSKRASSNRHPHPHPHPQPQPPNSCTYNAVTGTLTSASTDGCPSQIQPGNESCQTDGSSSPIDVDALQCSSVDVLSKSNTQPQDCTVKGSNGGMISVKALQCSTVNVLSIFNNKSQ